MPASIQTNTGSLELPHLQIQAIVRNAERRAELTVAKLDDWGYRESKSCHLPPAFLLELSAVLELGLWERQAFRHYLNTDLPTFEEAKVQLAGRAFKGPAEFASPNASPLSEAVLRVWIEQFAWKGPELLQAEVLVGPVDEDEFADVLAAFVWQHRHELSRVFQPNHEESHETTH
ncbi:MAG: hypothetical protein ABFC77_13585 [Thermoguttaceae bacterium]